MDQPKEQEAQCLTVLSAQALERSSLDKRSEREAPRVFSKGGSWRATGEDEEEEEEEEEDAGEEREAAAGSQRQRAPKLQTLKELRRDGGDRGDPDAGLRSRTANRLAALPRAYEQDLVKEPVKLGFAPFFSMYCGESWFSPLSQTKVTDHWNRCLSLIPLRTSDEISRFTSYISLLQRTGELSLVDDRHRSLLWHATLFNDVDAIRAILDVALNEPSTHGVPTSLFYRDSVYQVSPRQLAGRHKDTYLQSLIEDCEALVQHQYSERLAYMVC